MPLNLFDLYAQDAAVMLSRGAIGVIPTETVYGIGTGAFNRAAVEKIFSLKMRPAHKPFAVLIGDLSELRRFGISQDMIAAAEQYWPGAYTVIFKNTDEQWRYLHRDSGGLSFRLPAEPHFKAFLQKSGPLATTSANLSGQNTVSTAEDAYAVFGDHVAVYMPPSPWMSGKASTVVDLKSSHAQIIRP